MTDSNTPSTHGSSNSMPPESSLKNDAPRMTNQLTSFQDQTPQQVVAPGSDQIPVPDPYPSQGMENVLSRLMKVNNFQWGVTDTQGTIIGSVSLPNDLLAIQSIWERAGRFKYLRGDLELQIRTNSTQFHYGQLLMYEIPDTESTEVTSLVTDLWTASQLRPKLILANSCTELTVKIPYQHQFDFIDLEKVNGDPDSIARIGFVVLNKLHSANANADDTLDVTVWARFTNLRVAGPKTTLGTKPTLLPFQKLTIGETQKKKKKVKKAHHATRPVPQSEQIAKSSEGMTAGIGERVKSFAANFTSLPIVGGIASAAEAVGSVLSDIGLNKPDDVSVVQNVYNDPFIQQFSGKGLDIAKAAALDPTAHVSDDQGVFGISDPACQSFKALAQVPSLYETMEIPTTTLPETIIATFPLVPTARWNADVRYDNWFAAAARQFLFWRGGVKYLFAFSASSFTTARFRLTYHPDLIASSAEADNGGDVISQIIDVKGDTITRMTLPYLHSKPVTRVPYGDAPAGVENGQLVLSLVNKIIDFDTTVEDSCIQLSVWIAGAEDTMFSVPYFPRSPTVTPPTPEGDIRDVFKASFPPIIKAEHKLQHKYTLSENEMSIKTYLHRYFNSMTITGATVFSTAGFYPPYATTARQQPIWNWFRFKRGSMRFHFNREYSATGARVWLGYIEVTSGDGDPTYGYQSYMNFLANPTQNSNWVTVPYNCNAKFIKSADSGVDRKVTFTSPFYSTASATDLSFAAGDDISFGGLGTSPTIPDPS